MNKKNFFKDHPWALHVLVMLGLSIVILMLVFLFIRIYARQGEEYALPDFEGTKIEEAMENNELDLSYVVLDSIYRHGEEGGIILTQDPRPGTMVKKGRKVYLTMTAYKAEEAVMPELAGLNVRQAVSELASMGLSVGKLKFVEDPYKNNIVDQTCKGKAVFAGQKIARGSVIDLVVGLGDGTGRSVVPFVLGKTAERARRDIQSLSLNVGKEHFKGVRDRNKAVVYKQDPDYTGVSHYPYGTEVELWYVDPDDIDVDRMVREFKVDSTKIIEDEYGDGRPTPDELDSREDWSW